MSFRRHVATGALAVALAMIAGTASAQGFGRGGGNLYTPEPGARDLKAVLFNWAWHMGMLRGQAEPELVQTLELRAVGTVDVDGQSCTLADFVEGEPGILGTAGYRISANYRIPGYRVHIDCTLPNGQTYSNIETMSGAYAWDEDIPGAEIVPGEGTATPMPGTLEERRIRLWASPHGAPKAAIAAAAGVSVFEAFGQNPAVLLDSQWSAGVESITTLEWQGNQPVLTFPLPDVPGATATATLSEDFLPQTVVVRHGRNTTEFVYDNYRDFNNPLHRIEALYAGRIIERQNGEVVRDLRTMQTEIGQVYVVVPVPNSVRAAGN
ncbi:MAG: hypothetical protein R3305_01840 [Gammaproteobacteria bacterium]|nr:hypothetical protein [Gammaproteobacteria bacterium]